MQSDALGLWVLLAGCVGPLLGCSSSDDDPFIEVPDTFRATFVAGEACMPSQIQTGASSTDSPPNYSMTFTVCRHRCISFDLSTVRVQQSFACYVGQCDMAVLTIVKANRVPGEENCNALELVEPPAGECTDQTFEFDDILSPPRFNDGEWIADDFTVTIPFFDIEQGEDVVSRIEAGEPTQQVLMDYPQTDPNRKFAVNFDPSHAGPPYQLDCHDIPPP
jgi:hypothetical protein